MPRIQHTFEGHFSQMKPSNIYANTTPFPNYLLNEVMPILKDTEWRLLCVIVRQTLGWKDATTGTRKSSDWMTRAQLIEKTGRNSEALSNALDSLIRQNVVEAQDGKGKSLRTPQERRQVRGRTYYSLHPLLIQRLNRVGTTSDNEHRESEHENAEKASTSSVFKAPHRKSEHREAGKPNGTKENTKQTETKCSKVSLSSFHSMGKGGIREGMQEDRLFKIRNLPPLSPAIQSFISDYRQRYIRHFSHEPPAVFYSALVRLHNVQREYSTLEMNQLLEIFFSCELAHIKAQRYSLEAFVHNVDVIGKMA